MINAFKQIKEQNVQMGFKEKIKHHNANVILVILITVNQIVNNVNMNVDHVLQILCVILAQILIEI